MIGDTGAVPLTARAPAAGYSLLDRARDVCLTLLYRAVIGLVFVAIVLPLVIILVSSFSSSLYFAFPPQGFSLVAYQRFWGNPTLRQALNNSITVGLATMAVSMFLAGLAAYAIDRFQFPSRAAIETWLMSPVMLPVLVLAIALLMFVNQLHAAYGFWSLVASHVLVTAPFALRVLLSSLAGFDRTLEEASASLGARPFETLRRVTIPILQPGIFAAAVLAFVMSFGQITMSLFMAGEALTTLPVQIFLIADWGYDVALTAVSVVVMAVALVVVVAVQMTTSLEEAV